MTARAQKIQRIGNSAGILLPAAWLAKLGLKPGAAVRVEVSDRRIVIQPEDRSRDVPVDARFAREVGAFLRRNKAILERLT
jgi:antitoxin component of MazEF toxin-antitoxin module